MMFDDPQRAMWSADILGTLCPDAGHMNHMPGHAYALCGEYEQAICADDMYVDPPRYALAALLAEQGHFDEAEDVHRTDLGLNGKRLRCAQHPRNVWALHGLVECLRQRGEPTEIVMYEAQLNTALTKTDMPKTSSCMCRADTATLTCCDT